MVRFPSIGSILLPLILAACGGGGNAAPAEDVRAAITEDIDAMNDTLTVDDPRTGAPLALTFDHVHEAVEETPGGRYVACVDYRSADGEVYDVDYYVDREGDAYRVEEVVLHKAGDETVISEQQRAELETRAGSAR